jgi:tetratricopeptide (TPR) repeat protein
MRRLILLLILGAWIAGPTHAGSRAAANAAFAGGNRAYQAGDYAQALQSFREALREGYGSADLFLNLGNTSYKLGELGWAVYYFEQARRRAPRDPDIRSNLALARGEALGAEQIPSTSALLDALVSLEDRISLAGGVRLGTGSLWIAVALLLYSWRPRAERGARRLRWGALGLAIAAAVIISVKAGQASLSPQALVVKATAAHTEPAEDSTVEFRLPAGSPVSLGRQREGWKEVVVSASLRGWISDDAIARFDTPR